MKSKSPKRNSKPLYGKWEGKKIKLTPGYVKAVRNLLKEECLMMQKVFPKNKECWVVGSASLLDLSHSDYLSLIFGAKEDKKWLKEQSHITVEIK